MWLEQVSGQWCHLLEQGTGGRARLWGGNHQELGFRHVKSEMLVGYLSRDVELAVEVRSGHIWKSSECRGHLNEDPMGKKC